MIRKLRAPLVIALIGAICAAVVLGVAWYRSRAITTASLLQRLPRSNALVVYVDFGALRRAGILNRLEGLQITEDPEYKEFVRKTGFDYTRDLHSALVAFGPAGKYLLVRGRFDWKSLESYVELEHGACVSSLCRMQGSTPDRRISFFPLKSDVMALAVSPDDSAALRMQESAPEGASEMPDAPMWMSVPAHLLQSGDLPEHARPFAHSMERAESVMISFAPERQRLGAKLDVHCRNSQDAAELASQLSRATELLRQMLEREHQKPDPAGFSGILTAGTFHSEGSRVYGYWPIEPAFLDALFAGS